MTYFSNINGAQKSNSKLCDTKSLQAQLRQDDRRKKHPTWELEQNSNVEI